MFCDNLISLRKLNGLSQEELAEQLNVSRQTLSKYETGESLPDIDRCKQRRFSASRWTTLSTTTLPPLA